MVGGSGSGSGSDSSAGGVNSSSSSDDSGRGNSSSSSRGGGSGCGSGDGGSDSDSGGSATPEATAAVAAATATAAAAPVAGAAAPAAAAAGEHRRGCGCGTALTSTGRALSRGIGGRRRLLPGGACSRPAWTLYRGTDRGSHSRGCGHGVLALRASFGSLAQQSPPSCRVGDQVEDKVTTPKKGGRRREPGLFLNSICRLASMSSLSAALMCAQLLPGAGLEPTNTTVRVRFVEHASPHVLPHTGSSQASPGSRQVLLTMQAGSCRVASALLCPSTGHTLVAAAWGAGHRP